MGDENWGSYFPLILCTVRAFLDERERGQKEGKRERVRGSCECGGALGELRDGIPLKGLSGGRGHVSYSPTLVARFLVDQRTAALHLVHV